MNNIHLEPLGNGVKIYVSESYHFSTDTILLADFSKPKAYKKCADLGTGCGTIPLLWLKGDKSLKIDAVELQQNACKLAEKSVELNGFADNMKIINADLRELNGILPLGCYDLVVCNLPEKTIEVFNLFSTSLNQHGIYNDFLCEILRFFLV